MKVFIVEDEHSSTLFLKEVISDNFHDVSVVGDADNIEEAAKLIRKVHPDLLLLDIEFPHGTAFDLIKELSGTGFIVIFITAHQKYALQAIKMSALDFIMKPIDPYELIQAIQKAKEEVSRNNDFERLQALLHNLNEEKGLHKVVLKDKGGFHIFNIHEIVRLEAQGSYTKFMIKGGQTILISKNIKEYDAMLNTHGFFRCHKSHLVNINFIQSYSRYAGEKLLLTDQSEIPLAQRKKDLLMKTLKTHAHIK
ncbi:LytR/AlgR family response regulator transcription factor [Roseivirga misakiensis]|uniref:DNA-binding response regulator n=1 Tax=Roseivirga misakiensis TaxID=1563681 RepID=A0A1E5T8E2_9BACT|nr:LytTR family DNA-binding domain-containing protein [Roseivirga misakiensis]OEK07643.1 hypothetical protein BFP71_00025 [Roseivirga misakiensis]